MSETTRKTVRQVKGTSILDKKFERVGLGPKPRGPLPVHPLVVLRDLRQGLLKSLDLYLKQQKGFPDREIALELRKLISGTFARSNYRIVVALHPDAPLEKGGRPHKDPNRVSKRRREVAKRFRDHLEVEGKVYRAQELTAADFDIDPTTVKRAVNEVEDLEARQQQRKAEREETINAIEAIHLGPRERAIAAMKAKYGKEGK